MIAKYAQELKAFVDQIESWSPGLSSLQVTEQLFEGLDSIAQVLVSSDDKFNGTHLVYDSRIAGETASQRLRRTQEVEQQYPDSSKVIHQWPDGWSVKQLQTYNDAMREGKIMGNCFAHDQTDWPHEVWAAHPDRAVDEVDRDMPAAPEEFQYGDINYAHSLPWPLYSLRDHNNVPHVSVDPEAATGESSALGPYNRNPRPEHTEKLIDWAQNTDAPTVRQHLNDWQNPPAPAQVNYHGPSEEESMRQWRNMGIMAHQAYGQVQPGDRIQLPSGAQGIVLRTLTDGRIECRVVGSSSHEFIPGPDPSIPLSIPQYGQQTWALSKVAGETTTQRLRRADELDKQYGPDTSQPIHEHTRLPVEDPDPDWDL